MSNVLSSLAINGGSFVSVGGTGTGIKYFNSPAYPPNPPTIANSYGWVLAPGGSGRQAAVNGQILSIDAGGDFLCPSSDTSSPAVTIGLYQSPNPSAASPTINTLASYQEPASALGIVYVPWTIHADIEGTTNSGLLQGNYRIQIDNGTVQTGSTTLISGVSFNSNPSMGFVVGVTFSQSGAGNVANMYEFQLSS